jgi:predicted lipoprotein with Yx(FWY)xxD motif
MKTFRSSGLIVIALILTVLLAACGDSMGQGTPANTASQSMNNGNSTNNSGNGMAYGTPTAKSTMGSNNNGNMNNNNNNKMGGITITPSMGGNTAAYIHTGMANINGKKVNVLMTNKGFAVYYYRADSMFKATCTGDCAKSWPPILAPQGMMTVSSSMTLPRQLSVHQTLNGSQLFYDGHALYTYASDMQPGTATGRAQDQLWYLVGLTL